MENVMFLKTDPAFTLANCAYSELRRQHRRLNHSGTQTAELDPVLSTDGNTDFSRKYDFARRVSVAARISMCVATRLPLRRWAENQHHIEPEAGVELQPEGESFSLDDQRLDYFVAQFDRMFPHYLIQEKMDSHNHDMNQDISRPRPLNITSQILIFRLENNIPVDIIEMTIDINIKDVKNFGNMDCSILTTAIHSKLLNEGEDGPWYRHLQSICFQPVPQDVHLPCVDEQDQDALVLVELSDEDSSDGDSSDED